MASRKTIDQKMFSIILATYNCSQKIENTLQSIISQNKELFELIVVDAASTDDTLDYIKQYENDLTLVSEKDNGIYDAFNKGIDKAVGKYIYFIGAGDCLQPGILERIKEHLPQETPALVYGDFYLMKQKIYQGKEFTNQNFITDNICHQAIFYHRDIFSIVGKYDLRYKVFSDWFFNFKCFTREEIIKKYIPHVIVDFEEGGLSSELNNDPAFKKDFPILIKKHLGVRPYLFSKGFLASPFLYSFGYNGWYTLLEKGNSFVNPFIYAYRYLKKAIIRVWAG